MKGDKILVSVKFVQAVAGGATDSSYDEISKVAKEILVTKKMMIKLKHFMLSGKL
jgi:hypothetical protein